MQAYLESSRYIDWKHKDVLEKAHELSNGLPTDEDIARACFLFVRDSIKHSSDFRLNPVTIKASEVLRYLTGYCYAKSHLLAALLRANSIPAGICYQRLTIEDGKPPYCLHSLNGIYLKKYGWYRVDARGNNTNVHADFCPPNEKLAFPVSVAGEYDLPEIWPEPVRIVTDMLENCSTYEQVVENLPDIQIAEAYI